MLCWLIGPDGAAEPDAKNVLVLFSSMTSDKGFLELADPAIRARVPGPITFFEAYLVNNRDEGTERWKEYEQTQAETFRRTYAQTRLDLVVAVSPQAFYFALDYRDKMFPGVPIVFTMVGDKEFSGRSWPGVTGLTIPIGIGQTIDLALRLHPDTRAVAVLSGPDWYWLGVTRLEILRYRGRVREIDLIENPSRTLLAKVNSLPPHTVVLFHLSPGMDRSDFGGWDLLNAVSKRWPTYSAWPSICLNYGCVGGAYSDTDKQSLETADIITRVLLGEHPDDIPVVHDSSLQVRVDSRALHHWGIPESALPAGSVILYRPPSFWESYRNYIVVATIVIFALVLFMIALMWQRARNRKAEAALQESEERFRAMADSIPALIWICDPHGKVTFRNDRRAEFTGLDPNGGSDDSWIACLHPDDQRNILDTFSQALANRRSFRAEYRLRRSDGAYRWMLDVAVPRVNAGGSFAGFIGSATDITDQKLAQQALEKVSAQMIETQEKERSRIARDLHDDVCQRLALLSMEIDQAKRVSGDPSEAKKKLQEIRKHCSEIAGDVQSLSHQLHSSKLELLGIEAAIHSFCRELSKQYNVNVDFTARNVPRHLPKEISLCLFRLAQEALQNALKYSGTSQFAVELLTMQNEIHLAVSDKGVGFDVEKAKRKQGLGLMSMQERVHLVHGVLSVESAPGMGTHILAVVPMDQRHPRDEEINEIAGVTGRA